MQSENLIPEKFAVKVKILKAIIYCTMVLTVAIFTIFSLFIGDYLRDYRGIENQMLKYFLIGYFFVSILPFLFALMRSADICNIIAKGEAFSETTLEKLSGITYACYAEAGVNAMFGLLVYFAFEFNMLISSFFAVALCGVIAVFVTVFKELVKSAKWLKDENMLTI